MGCTEPVDCDEVEESAQPAEELVCKITTCDSEHAECTEPVDCDEVEESAQPAEELVCKITICDSEHAECTEPVDCDEVERQAQERIARQLDPETPQFGNSSTSFGHHQWGSTKPTE